MLLKLPIYQLQYFYITYFYINIKQKPLNCGVARNANFCARRKILIIANAYASTLLCIRAAFSGASRAENSLKRALRASSGSM